MNANTLSLDAMAESNVALKGTRVEEEHNSDELAYWNNDLLAYIILEVISTIAEIVDAVFNGIQAIKQLG